MTLSKKNKKIYYIFLLTIFFTNITQIPDLIDNSGIKLLSYIPWLVLSFFVLTKKDSNGNKSKIYIGDSYIIYILTALFFLICLIIEISGKNGLGVSLLQPLLMSIFIYFISINTGKYITKSFFENILLVYAISGMIVSAFVYIEILKNGFSWSSGTYAYASKNSVSQILLTSFFIFIWLIGKQGKIRSIFYCIAAAILLYILFMLKSRASLLGLLLIIISVYFYRGYSKWTRVIMILSSLLMIVMLVTNEELRDFFIDNIIYAGRDSSDLNSISSGRVDMLKEVPELFTMYPLLGHGRYYIECMQLDALIETGLLGGIVINIIALLPIFYSIKNFYTYRSNIDFILMIVATCYYINAFFEQLAPFGPGVKCYFLWLLFGIVMAWREKNYVKNIMGYEYADNL